MSPITIRPATVADASVIARIHYDALDRFHEFYAAFFVRHPSEAQPIATKFGLEQSENLFLVAEDENRSVVGFVRYNMVDPTAGEDKTSGNADPSLWAVKEHTKELWDGLNKRDEEMDACIEKAVDGQRHVYIKHLMIDPAHQRKGIGGQLLAIVTALADAEGLPAFIMSSEESHGLYLKAGFKDLGTWTIDNGHWAAEIVKLESGLGIQGNEGLAEKYRGTMEVEAYMVRSPK